MSSDRVAAQAVSAAVQDPPHCGRPDAVSEAEEFALDPLVSPAGFSRASCWISTVILGIDRRRPPR